MITNYYFLIIFYTFHVFKWYQTNFLRLKLTELIAIKVEFYENSFGIENHENIEKLINELLIMFV